MTKFSENIAVGNLAVQILVNCAEGEVELVTRLSDAGFVLECALQEKGEAVIGRGALELMVRFPAIRAAGVWHPDQGMDNYSFGWGRGFISRLARFSPVLGVFGYEDENQLTAAHDEALYPVETEYRILEEDAMVQLVFRRDLSDSRGLEPWHFRLDARALRYDAALGAVAEWWQSMSEYEPETVPDWVKRPVYSTWYCYHQDLAPEELERTSADYKALGCESIIVDDGWQTDDSKRKYGFCGDWEVSRNRFPDFPGHIQRVKDAGLRYILWYSVPYIGIYSENFNRFLGQYLDYNEKMEVAVLDPRYPNVRDFLVKTYAAAVRDWDLDGLKLDFFDDFVEGDLGPYTDHSTEYRRDVSTVEEGITRLLEEIRAALETVKAGVVFEFRQRYSGPLMQRFGHFFRAMDCPADAYRNRLLTTSLRLLAGRTVTHSDMLMWHPEAAVEDAALQLLNVLYSVPQVSIRLDEFPESHGAMLRFWLEFWNEHRGALLDGTFEAEAPLLGYPLLRGIDRSSDETVYGVYARDTIVPVNRGTSQHWLVNATGGTSIVLRPEAACAYRARIFDTLGQAVGEEHVEGALASIEVPKSGLLELVMR